MFLLELSREEYMQRLTEDSLQVSLTSEAGAGDTVGGKVVCWGE